MPKKPAHVIRISPEVRRRHTLNQLRQLLAGGAISTSIHAAATLDAGLDNLDLEHIIETGMLVSVRAATSQVFEGVCQRCIVEGQTVEGRRARLLIDMRAGVEGIITGFRWVR